MAITVNTAVIEESSTNSTTLNITGVTAAVGDFILVLASSQYTSGGGAAHAMSSASDSAGNTYASRYNAGTAASAGISLGIFTTKVSSTLTSGTVTVNFSSNVRAKTALVYVLEPSSGNEVYVRLVGAGTATGNVTSFSTTSSSITSGDIVFYVAGTDVRLVGSGYNLVPDSDTTRGSWSTYVTTEIGTANSIVEQHKTVTSTGTQTWNLSTDSSTYWHHNYISVYEAAASNDATVVGESGTYSVSGAAATLQYSKIFASDTGSYLITGADSSGIYGKAVFADTASYTISGQTAGLIVGGAPSGITLEAIGGSYTVSGQDITYDRNYAIGAATASYTISGADADFYKGKTVVASTAAYSISGTAASFLYGYKAVGDAGAYSISGTDNTFLKGSFVVAASGSYSVSGQAITMTAGQRRMDGDSGSYTLTGTSVGLFPAPPVGTVLQGPDPRITFWSNRDGLVLSFPFGYSFAKYIRRSYNVNGNGNIFITTAAGSGIFDSRGHVRVTIVDGSSYTGIYATDGSINAIVVDVDDLDPDQLFHETGALRISQATLDTPGLINQNNGSLLVANIP